MDNIRVFLWLTLLGMVWLVYTAWNADYGARPPPPGPRTTTDAPQTADQPPDLPSLNEQGGPAPPQQQLPTVAAQPAPSTGELIHVQTDVLDVRIASQGGDLVRADLPQHRVHKDMPEPVIRLLDDSGPERWVFQSGVRSAVGGDEPNHAATFRSASNEYMLEPVVTHEVGHAYGLDHVGEINHGRLTMSIFIDGTCENQESTLGLGDMKGLEALY